MIKIITPQDYKTIFSLTTIKSHLRITESDYDDLIEDVYLPSAISTFQSITNIAIGLQTVKQVFDCFPKESYFNLELSPFSVSEVTNIQYYNEKNVLTTFDAANYFFSTGTPDNVNLNTNKQWPIDIHQTRLSAVEVNYKTGHANIENLPKEIFHIICLMLGDFIQFTDDTIAQSGVVVVNSSWHSTRMMRKFRQFFYQHPSQTRIL